MTEIKYHTIECIARILGGMDCICGFSEARMTEQPERIKASYSFDDTGLAICGYCNLQLGEGLDNCINCALAEYEYEAGEIEIIKAWMFGHGCLDAYNAHITGGR